MLNPSSNTSVTSDAQILSNVQDVVNLFRAGLPERRSWLSAILRVPAHAWTFEISQSRECVEEAVRVNLDLASTKFRAEFLSQHKFTSDLETVVINKGWISFDRKPFSFRDQSLSAIDDERLSDKQSIQLNQFPSAIGAIVEGVRDRLIEPEHYQARFNAQLEIAREWKRGEQWGLQVLRSLLSVTPLNQNRMNREKATTLARLVLSKECPITEDNDVYEVGSVRSASERSYKDGFKIEAINFDASMTDRYGNEYPSHYLYIRVSSEGGREAEFFFDASWSREFKEFQKLAR